MGDWYRVVKTIKGHRYIYEQQTYREGGRVRTRNRYLGSAGGEETAERKAQEYLEENSPLRNWEIYSEGEKAEIDVVAIKI